MASLSFPTKFLWAIVKACIWPTPLDNTLTLEHAVLVASIFAHYNIDWSCLIAE